MCPHCDHWSFVQQIGIKCIFISRPYARLLWHGKRTAGSCPRGAYWLVGKRGWCTAWASSWAIQKALCALGCRGRPRGARPVKDEEELEGRSVFPGEGRLWVMAFLQELKGQCSWQLSALAVPTVRSLPTESPTAHSFTFFRALLTHWIFGGPSQTTLLKIAASTPISR